MIASVQRRGAAAKKCLITTICRSAHTKALARAHIHARLREHACIIRLHVYIYTYMSARIYMYIRAQAGIQYDTRKL